MVLSNRDGVDEAGVGLSRGIGLVHGAGTLFIEAGDVFGHTIARTPGAKIC